MAEQFGFSESVSRVTLDHFGPDGIRQLSRTFSRSSGQPGLRSVRSDGTLVPVQAHSLEKTLRATLDKQRDPNIQRRELGVYFKDLRVIGVGATASHQSTVGSMFNPKAILQGLRNSLKPSTRTILHDFNGVVRPGEMLLVLGSPGSGCTTFLKMLANQRDTYHDVQGRVHYDSMSPKQIDAHYRGDVQYSPEDDVHFPTLTVEQTIRFAARTRTPHVRAGGQSRDELIEEITDVLTTVFGLTHVRKTLVGDAGIRGVSGGEKKRVSIAEALACRSLINCWDNSTRGLDSSTALEFALALRIGTDIAGITTAVSVYQASENVYGFFDKVCVIYEGRMVYYGPTSLARQYFIDMGYQPANRQTTPDFLVAVTDPNARIIRSGYENLVPRTADEFVEHYRKSNIWQINQEDMDAYLRDFVGKPQRTAAYMESARAEHATTSKKKSAYVISIPMQTRAVMVRRLQILKGNMGGQIAQIAAFLIQAVVVGTVFLRIPSTTATFFSRGGVLYFAILFAALSSMAEIPTLYAHRPLILRHQKAAMYHPFIEATAMTLVDIPITLATLTVYCLVLYFVVGLQASASQFFIFFLIIVSTSLIMKAYFRTIAAVFSDPTPAQATAGVSLLALTIYTGYNIPETYMIGALKWITYINPLKYVYEAIMVNEFRTLDLKCSNLVPQGPGYENTTLENQVCAVVGSVPGQMTVNGLRYLKLSFNYEWSHMWMNFGITLAFGVGFLAAYLIITEFKSKLDETRSVLTFKRGTTQIQASTPPSDDVEAVAPTAANPANDLRPDGKKAETALATAEKMTDKFSWEGLNYKVPVSGGGERRLLNNISGYVVPGKLTALMGESGAGKTTLLNVLASRTSTGVITGDRLVNGQSLPADFQAQTGYCQQMDTHEPTSSVREAILFSAILRQPQDVPMAEKEAYVEKCLLMCGLEMCADAIVGTLGVEQRKRLTIAIELAAKPKLLLFLDEPTSGLDSQSAWAIVSFLRTLADNGQAILCTIHQPSAELFQVFDRLLLLRKGGETVYFGDLGNNSTTLINYFERNGSRVCGPEENPAEFMLDVIGAGATATSTTDWHDVWRKSPEAAAATREIHRIHDEGRKRPAVTTKRHTQYSTSWIHQTRVVMQRSAAAIWRDPVYVRAKLTLNIVAGLFIGFTFWKSPSTLQGCQNKLFSIFSCLILTVPGAQQLQIPFIASRTIYEIRERPSKMYSWTAWVTSQILVELPWNMSGGVLLFFCWYWTVGYPTDRAGYTFFIFAVLVPFYYTTIGQAVAALSPTLEVAALLFTSTFSLVLIFNGVIQPFSQLGWWRWMYRLSPYTYLMEGLMGNVLGGQQITCSDVEYSTIPPPAGLTCSQYMDSYIARAGGYLTNPDATSDCRFCSFRTTDEYLDLSFNIKYSHRWRDVGIFVGFIVFNTAMVYLFTYLFRMKQWDGLRLFSRGKSTPKPQPVSEPKEK